MHQYYNFWKHHSKQSIRETLAKNGFFRDEFIKTRNIQFDWRPWNGSGISYKLANKLKTDTEKWQIAKRFRQMPNITIEQIDFILQNNYIITMNAHFI